MIQTIVDWRRGSFRPGLVFEDSDLAILDVPTLMIYGASDPAGSVEIWQRFTEALPRASLLVIESAGHMPWFHDPAGIGLEVERFLRSKGTSA